MESSATFNRALSTVFSFQVMLAFLLGSLIWILAWGKNNDPDIWWHMRNAEYLIQTHHFPNQDMYSFTAEGDPWINHAWLAEIPYYLAWRTGRLLGIDILWISVAELIFGGLLYLCWRSSGNLKASVVACGLCCFLAVVSFGPRTILFGYACLVALQIVLERFRSRGRGPLWLIPPLMCLWINTHASWPLGFMVFGIFVASGLFEGQWGRIESVRWSRSALTKLIVTGAAGAAALFVNPFGWLLVRYPIDLGSKQKLNVAHIQEWMSVDFHEARGKIILLLLIGLLMAAMVRKKTWRLAEVGWLMLAIVMGLTYVRFLFFLAIIAAPILARFLDFIPAYDRKSDRPLINLVAIGSLLFAGIQYYPRPSEAVLEEMLAEEYPVQIVEYLKSHPPAGRLINDYLWGGFLIWHDRDLKVFIDSRVDIFEYAGVFADYVDLVDIKNVDQIVDKYKIRYVLFSANGRLTRLLEHDPNWKPIYRDSLSVLFEKTNLKTDL